MLLIEQTGLGPAAVSLLLVTSGVSGTVGTIVGGTTADRHPRHTLTAAAALPAISMSVIPLIVTSPALTWPAALIWAAAFGAFSTAAQVNVSLQATPAAGIAAAANISMSNIGIACGSAAGGLALHLVGYTGITLTGAALTVAGLTTALLLPPPLKRVCPSGDSSAMASPSPRT